MLLRKTYIPKRPACAGRGFTLIELVVVLGVLALLASCALVISMDSYTSNTFSDQELLLVTALQKARSEAMNGTCIGVCSAGLPHGVHVSATSITIFQGSTYAAGDDTNEVIAFTSRTLQVAGVTEVVFAELSGNVSPTASITLSDSAGHTSTITVGSEGQLLW